MEKHVENVFKENVFERMKTLAADIVKMTGERLKGVPASEAFIMAGSALMSALDVTSEKYGRDPGKTRRHLIEAGKYADAEMEKARGQEYWQETARDFWKEGGGWVSVKEQFPKTDEDGCSTYVLLSFENYTLPCIGRYEGNKDGGAFYKWDSDEPLSDIGMKVNAWMPLPEVYRQQGE